MKVNKTIKYSILFLMLSNFLILNSFATDIVLDNTAFISGVGGSKQDIFHNGVENSLGELVAIGRTNSESDLGSSPLGGEDALIVKYSSTGTLSWSKRLGGSGTDRLESIVLNEDDSVVVVGRSNSTDAEFSINGSFDAIIAKISNSGDTEWIKNYGGNSVDLFSDVIKTNDGGYLAVGKTTSTDLENSNLGESDFLITKFDSNGDKQWAKSYGGSGEDEANAVIEVSDGYIIAGQSSSKDAGYTNKGYVDGIILKLDLNGDKQWIKGFGGGPYDNFRSIAKVADGFICTGETYSNTNEIQNNGPSGTKDAVLVKYNLDGDIQFIKTFGGSEGDVFTQIINTHTGNYMAIGYSSSTDAGFINKGSKDAILVQYDTNGNQLKVDGFGGNGSEEINKGTYSYDGSLVFFGESSSTNLEYENKGGADAVAFKYNLSIEEAVNAVVYAETTRFSDDISTARSKVSVLPESIHKVSLTRRVDAIIPLEDTFPGLELKNSTFNLDVYIKSENILSMSLNTNSITFEDFSGTEDMVKDNAINIRINSSLPYSLNAYLPVEIQNSDKTNTMDKSILNIKENSETIYQTFINSTDKIVLKDNNTAGNDLVHGIDIKLKGGIAHEKDVYKTIIKFEAEQK